MKSVSDVKYLKYLKYLKFMKSTLGICCALLVTMLAAGASADVRTLEAVGTIPIDPQGNTTTIPRDAAIDQALREAVTRVAQDFLADRWIDEPGDPDPALDPIDAALIDAGNQDATDSLGDPLSDPEPFDLEAVLGKKMVPYTSRYTVIEDRGRRPALFSEDPEVTEEYVVIVEVQVDADRVQTKLVDAGLIPAGSATVGSNDVLVEVEGLTAYPAYQAFRGVLEGPLGALKVTPVEMSQGRTILDVETESSAVDLLEALLLAAPSDLEIVPIHAGGSRVHVVVKWNGPQTASGDAAAQGAGRQ